MLVIRNAGGEVLLIRRPPSGIWGGLYGLPELSEAEDPKAWCRQYLGVEIDVREDTESNRLEHSFSHFDLVIHSLEVHLYATSNALMDREGWLWYNPAQGRRVGIAAPIAILLKAQNHSREESP